MMVTYYDALNYTYKSFELDPPPASAQLVFMHLLHLNNRLGNTGTVQISDGELGRRTRLSKQTITEAKRTLKNHGWIDFKTDRDKPHKATVYTLPLFSEKVGQSVGQTLGRKVGQSVGQTLGQPSRLSPHFDSAFLRKTEEERPKTLPPTPQGARGASAGGSEQDSLRGTEPPPDEDNDIFKVWAKEARIPLNARQRYELCELCEDPKYGFAKVKVAIERMVDSRSYQTYDAFKEILEGKEKTATVKEDETSGKREHQYAKPPEYDFLDEWEQRKAANPVERNSTRF